MDYANIGQAGDLLGLGDQALRYVGGFAILATLTSNKSNQFPADSFMGKLVQFALDLVNVAGCNVGKARNPEEPNNGGSQ